jgi:hypothetical protein
MAIPSAHFGRELNMGQIRVRREEVTLVEPVSISSIGEGGLRAFVIDSNDDRGMREYPHRM